MFELGKHELEIGRGGKLRPKAFRGVSSVDQLQQPLSCRHDGASGIAGMIEQASLTMPAVSSTFLSVLARALRRERHFALIE
jgi:hypothetical protein